MDRTRLKEILQENLEGVRRSIAEAAEKAGRAPGEVTLVAVTKYIGRVEVEALIDSGVRAFGENRVQGAEDKVVRGIGVSWHMIGHLQRNKVRKALRTFDWIESVDSIRLARKLDEEASRMDGKVAVLCEVNVSGESAKTGLPAGEAIPLLREMASLPHLEVRGMMAMAPLSDDPEGSRPCFRKVREIRDAAREATGLALPDLSMGMSQDYTVAIEEGATLVRIGRALYQGII